jgi:DNA-binding IclR family transcriptional regulator
MSGLKTPSVPALERALLIVELLAASRAGMTLAEIAHHLHLPKSSVHCLLLTLERHGYLHRHERSNRYLFGTKFFSLGNMALSGLDLRETAAPFLRALMEATRLTVHMAILERFEAVLIDKVEPPGIFKLATWLGKRMDVHCTGVGKALIAHLPDDELDLLVREQGLPRHNDNTVVSLRKLKEDLACIRKLGYSTDDEEDEVGLRCIGSPVFDRAGKVVAAASISGTTTQIREDNSQALALELKRTAAAISRALGYHAAPSASDDGVSLAT